MGTCVSVEEDAGKVAPHDDGRITKSIGVTDAFETPVATDDQTGHLSWTKSWDHPWPKPPIAPNDKERCEMVEKYNIMDSEPEDVFDRLCDLGCDILKAPFVAVDILNADKHFFKSISTSLVLPEDILRERGIPREGSCCNFVLKTGKMLIIPDMSTDSVFEKAPAYDALGFRFYAGAPLRNKDGFVLGTMCVMSPAPCHDWTQQNVNLLSNIASTAMRQIEVRKEKMDETSAATTAMA